MQQIINKLKEVNKTISTMESCLGGGLANEITNVAGASEIFKFGAVTYSNEFKIKMGVSKDIIDKYSVYSIETATEMSKAICNYTASNYGVGITGKLNRSDANNLYGDDSTVFISIYDSDNKKYYHQKLKAIKTTRQENKKLIISEIKRMLLDIIK